MRIRIHTCDVRCLGRACFSLLEILQKQKHVVDLNVVWFDDKEPLLDDGAVELNIIVAGMFIMKRLAKHGLPQKSRNVMWLVDPLPDDLESEHYHKTKAFLAFADKLDGLAAMNNPIQDFVRTHVKGLPNWILPYRISSRFIREPLDDALRTCDFMHLAHMSPRRENAEKMLANAGIILKSIRGGVWMDHRDEILRGTRILLQIHLDEHFYFDQVRIIDSWSLGVPVVAEEVPDMMNYPVENGRHIAAVKLSEFPIIAKELLEDSTKRKRMASDAQELLRERFLNTSFSDTIKELLDTSMSH